MAGEIVGEKNQNRRLIHIYCGDGKGKTTASVGLMVRASGHGWRVLLVQFLKNGTSGEIGPLRQLPNITVLTEAITSHFTNHMTEQDRMDTKVRHEHLFMQAVDLARQGQVDLLVLDEVFGAIATGLLDRDLLYEFLVGKPAGVEVVLTGRDPDPLFLGLADYVSEIKCRSHPYEHGILAREGIEY